MSNFFVGLLSLVWCLMFRVCLCRIQHTNTLRSYWLILPTMPFAMTQESTGSATQYTSTGNSADSPLLARNTGVFVARDTCTTRLDLQEGQTGRETTLSLFDATGDPLDHIWCFCYRLTFVSVVGLKILRQFYWVWTSLNRLSSGYWDMCSLNKCGIFHHLKECLKVCLMLCYNLYLFK